MVSVLNVVSQTQLVAIAPRWLAEEFSDALNLQILPLPLKLNSRTCYLSGMKLQGGTKGISGWKNYLSASAAVNQVRINCIFACGLSRFCFVNYYFILFWIFSDGCQTCKIDDFLNHCAFQR